MKIKYSNKVLLDNLSKNYSVRQSNRSSNVLYASIAGIAAGLFVASFMNYFQKKKIDGLLDIIKKQRIQNDQLLLDNQILKEKNKDDFLNSSEPENVNTLTESEVPNFVDSNNEEIENKI